MKSGNTWTIGSCAIFRDLNQFGTRTGSDKKDKMLVMAIDFGANFSSYAYSFIHDPSKVSVNHSWLAGSMAILSLKSPTVVLFDENKKCHSFGYDAAYTYTDLALDNEHHKWFFFKRFKMLLHGKKMTLDVDIEDVSGRKMKAIDVFGAAFKYLRDHLLSTLKKRGVEVLNKEIGYVLTVPAIFGLSAKQFMREAACKADIDGEQLSIVSDPEAASLYCQVHPDHKNRVSAGAKFDVSSPGTKYMVIDARDNMTYITVHETQADGKLNVLHTVSCGACCGTGVDKEFYDLLIRIIGGAVYQTFVDENESDQLDLQRELKTIKGIISPQSTGKITIKVPIALLHTFEKETKDDIKDVIEGSPYCGKITWRQDKMRIEAQVFKDLFKSCTGEIVSHIKDLLEQPAVQETNIFLTIGTFSESAMLQDAIIEAFPKGKVFIPDDAGLTALKGAVLFGHTPAAITSCVSKYTYGINISPPFEPNIHPQDHRVSAGGIDRCRDVFKKYILAGETVQFGEARIGIHVTEESHQREMLLKVYCSPKTNPMFVDDDAEYLGEVVVFLPDCKEKIRVEVNMIFGETVLEVIATELSNNEQRRGYFDLL